MSRTIKTMKMGLAPLAGMLALLLAGCQPDSTDCRFGEVADLPVVFEHGIPIVTAEIDGQTVHMALDSGAAFAILTPDAYDRLDLTGTVAITGSATGVGGKVPLNTLILRDVTFGTLTEKNNPIVITDLGMPKGDKLQIDGIIGEDLLQRLDVGLDLPDHRILLYVPVHCPMHAAPWPGDYAVLPFTLADKNHAPMIGAEIDGVGVQLALDSGAVGTVVTSSFLRDHGIRPNAVARRSIPLVGLGGMKAPQTAERFAHVTIGAEEFSDRWLLVARRDIGIGQDGLLGEDYLRTHRVFVQNSTQTVYLGLSTHP